MNRRLLRAGLFLAVAIVAGGVGFYSGRGSTSSSATEGAVRSLMLTSLPDLSGKQQLMSQWHGKVLVLNYWATWCAPCREEIPALIRVQHRYAANGVQLVGIAIDNLPKVLDYAKEMQIDYTLLIGGMESLSAARDLGNRAGVLPFTVVLDRTGKMAYAHAGALTEVSLGKVLTPLL